MLLLAAFLGLAALGQTAWSCFATWTCRCRASSALATSSPLSWWSGPLVVRGLTAGIIGGAILLGGVSGLICHYFRVQSIVVTLGMNFVLLGVIGVLAGSGITGAAPAWLTHSPGVSPSFGSGCRRWSFSGW